MFSLVRIFVRVEPEKELHWKVQVDIYGRTAQVLYHRGLFPKIHDSRGRHIIMVQIRLPVPFIFKVSFSIPRLPRGSRYSLWNDG